MKRLKYKKLSNFGYYDALPSFMNYLGDRYYDSDNEDEISSGTSSYTYFDFPIEDDSDSESIDIIKEPLNLTKAEEKYSKNILVSYRRTGDYIVSDYKDGVCINKVVYDKTKYKAKSDRTIININIPEEIDGKKVIKLGGYLEKIDYDSDEQYSFYGAYDNINRIYGVKGFLCEFPPEFSIKLKIPSTVSDITAEALQAVYRNDDELDSREEAGYIIDVDVDKRNPYYTSRSGVLYTKDMSWMLFFRPDDNGENGKEQMFTVPDSVKYIADTNICHTDSDARYTMKIGNNVKKIYSEIWEGECGVTNCTFKVEKGSYAEKWLKKETYNEDYDTF